MSWVYRSRGVWAALPLLGMQWLLPSCSWSPWGVGSLIAAVGMRVWARREAGEHTRGAALDADALCTRGAYSVVRHPLYISNLLMGAGIVGLDLGVHGLSGGLVLYWCVLYVLLAAQEDRWLRRRFGAVWNAWAAKTPAWVPGWRLPQGPYRRGVWAAVRGDRWTWLWLGLVLGWVFWRKTGCV